MSAGARERRHLVRGAQSPGDLKGEFFLLMFLILLCFYGTFFALWAAGEQDTYSAAMYFFGVDNWQWPFLDLAGVLSWGDCHQQGVDVLANNPCDVLGRRFNYSPILLDLPMNWIGLRNLNAAGLILDGSFILAMTLVFMPSSWRGIGLGILGGISSSALFAAESANIDVLMFTMVVAAGFISRRTLYGRLWSYAVYVAATLIKFFPIVLLIMAVRERLRVFATILLVSIAILAVFLALYWSDILKLPALMPELNLSWNFGARLLPFAAEERFHSPFAQIGAYALVTCAIFAGGLVLAARLRAVFVGIDWDERHFHFLAAGAFVMLICFFTDSNNYYRAIFLLLTLPGLAGLRQRVQGKTLRRIVSWTLVATVFCLWEPFFLVPSQNLLYLGAAVYIAVRELIWWWVMAFFVAVVFRFILDSQAVKDIAARAGSRRAPLVHRKA